MNIASVILPLRPNDFSVSIHPVPTIGFVEEVDRRLRRDRGAPGIVIIPNTRTELRTRKRVLTFQRNLMHRLHLHACNEDGRFRSRGIVPGWKKRTATSALQVNQIGVDGLHSYRMPHMDADSQGIVSLCHARRHDIEGGIPLFVDLHRLLETRDLRACRRALRTIEHAEGEYFFVPGEVGAQLAPEYLTRARRQRLLCDFLDLDEMPIIVFANRLEDGILHGATGIRSVGPKPDRVVKYASIGYRKTP